MENWKTVRLGDYITEYSVKNKSNEDIPVYSVTNTQGFCTEYFSKDVSSKDKSNYKIVPRGCFAYNPSRINVGSVDWQRYEDRVIVSPLYNVFKVSPELENQYLYYFLKSDIGHTLITSKAEGSVRDNLKITMLAEFSIPLPHLEEQKHIAAMLDKCTALVTKYKLMLEKYDTLIKSRFIEMFGDDKYPKIHISEMVERKVASAKKIFDKKDEIKYIDISSVDNKINEIVGYTECVFEEAPSRAQQHIRQNDILISTVRPNLKNIAINKLPYTETVASSGFCVLRPKYVPEYLFVAVLQDKFTDDMVAVTTGANYPAIKDSDILNYEIANPPIELQTAFARFVQQIDKSKFAVQKSLEKAEILYKSLMQEYFE